MRLTESQLRKAIRGVIVESMGNVQACLDECLAAIPGMMKKMCGIGMSHMVTNDIYHLCVPICQKHGCDPDDISRQVESILCGRR